MADANNTSTSSAELVQVYADLMSQPARAVVWFCMLNNIPHQVRLTHIFKQEHLTEEYAKLNPHKKIPVIEYKGFALYESHAILRYLHGVFGVNDHWYPSDLQKRSRVDAYLDWHHTNTRLTASGYFVKKYLFPLRGLQVSEQELQKAEKELVKCLQAIEKIFLKDSPYLAGDQVTIADISAFSELYQLELVNYDWRSRYPNINKWANRIQSLPHYDHVFKVLHRVKKSSSQQAKL